mgnify:CR=1 FL=1
MTTKLTSLGVTSVFALLLSPGLGLAQGPSFDCAKAHSWSEHQVCNDPELAELDQQMAARYKALKSHRQGDDDRLKTTQRRWLHDREQCQQAQSPKTCLRQRYQERLGELNALAGSTQTNSGTQPALTPQVVWNHSEAIYDQCDIPDFECVLKLMKTQGASPEAQEFVRKHEAWVIEFTEYGNTDLLLLETFRANTNQYYALASRVAGVIAAEGYDLSPQDQQRREVIAVLSRHPQTFFIAKPSFIRHTEGPNGASRFVFQDVLAECRACEPLARGELMYEFDAAGQFLGVKLGDFQPL